jgi:acetoin utilization protein AcuB
MKVASIMSRKIVLIGMDDSVAQAQELFQRHHFHHLLVVEGRGLVGILSDRDLLRNISPFVGHLFTERPQDRALLQRRVHQIMTRHPVTITGDASVAEAARRMLDAEVSCLPVVDTHEAPVGIVSWKDLLRGLLASGEELMHSKEEHGPPLP